MRVLFVSAFGAWGRPASYIQSQSDSLKRNGVNISDFYLRHRGIGGYVKSYFELKKYLKTNQKFDIVHAHFGYTAFIVFLTSYKAKFVISFMGDDLYGILDDNMQQTAKGRFNIVLARFLQSRADWIIVKSNRMLDFIKDEYKQITTVVPNGVDYEKFPLVEQSAAREKLNLDPSLRYLLFLGSPNEKRKNFQLVKNAFDLLADNNAVLLNPYPVDGEDVYLYLNACDVLVLASILEGSPNVIKEALVCNCPIVATDVGDVPERIKGVDGCYLAEFNANDMAAKMKLALAFNSRTNGRNMSAYLKTDNIAQRIVNTYQLVLSQTPRM